MTILYKLTTQDCKTRPGYDNECIWGPGITHRGTGEGGLCGPGYIHACTDPLLAVLLNPIHANIHNPRLWECEGEVAKDDHGLKVGCVELTTIREIDVPEVTTEQRVKFAILCAKAVCRDEQFNTWADAWLAGEDRSYNTAWWASPSTAGRAAEAARAAEEAASAAWSPLWSAEAASRAAWASAWASADDVDLPALAREAAS